MKIRFCCMIDGKDICGEATDCITDLCDFSSRYLYDATLTVVEPNKEFRSKIWHLCNALNEAEWAIIGDTTEEFRAFFGVVHASDILELLNYLSKKFEN